MHPKKVSSPQFNREFAEVVSRIRDSMVQIVPESWESAELVVRENYPESDDFLEIDTPLINPTTDEIIGNLPADLLKAVEDLYLLFPAYYRPWETCVISLQPISSGNNRHLRTQFFYAK